MRAIRLGVFCGAVALAKWGVAAEELFSPTVADRAELCVLEECLVLVGPPSFAQRSNQDYEYTSGWIQLQVEVSPESNRGGRTQAWVGESISAPDVPGELPVEFSGKRRDWRVYRDLNDEARQPEVWFEAGERSVIVSGKIRFLTPLYGPEGFTIFGGSTAIEQKGWHDDPFAFSDVITFTFEAGKRYALRAEPAGLHVDEGIYVWMENLDTGDAVVEKVRIGEWRVKNKEL